MRKTTILFASLCFVVAGILVQAASAQKAGKVGNVAGTWDSIIKMPSQTVNQQWTVQQKADKLMGTVKSDHGDLSFTGSLDDSGFFRADVKDGDEIYKVRASLNNDKTSMDGSITMKNKEYLWSAKHAQ